MMRSLRLLIVILLGLGLHPGAAQPGSGPPLSGVYVSVMPSPNGDVVLSVIDAALLANPSSGSRSSIDYSAIIRKELRCEVPEEAWDPRITGADCRRMLRSDGAYAEGTLRLASLVGALHKAGVKRVVTRVYLSGDRPSDQAPPSGWEQQGR